MTVMGEFGESSWRITHARAVDASPQRTWDALEQIRYGDLRVTRVLMRVRHLGTVDLDGDDRLLTNGPLTLFSLDPPRRAVAGMVAKPWVRGAPKRPVSTVGQVADFAEPGWVKVITDFVVSPLEDRRCLLSTTTWVWPTDPRAERAFTGYWTLLRPFLGVVRRDVLRSVAHLAD